MATSDDIHTEEEKETSRLEAFSDGVFAIAITLLVLNLQPPTLVGGKPLNPLTATTAQLLTALGQQWPFYLAYFVSFVFILIMWVNHHNMFRLIVRSDQNFLLLNGLLLMFITIVPFPTTLAAQYISHPGAKGAVIVYSAAFEMIAIFYNLLWRYAARNNRLISRKADQRLVDGITRSYRFGPLLYLVCFALAFINVYASLGLSLLLALYFAFPAVTKLIRRRAPRPDESLDASLDPLLTPGDRASRRQRDG